MHAGTKTKDNRINIEFDPAKSKKVTECEKIVQSQICQIVVDGRNLKPTDYWPTWKYRDKVMTGSKWWIDHQWGETTPDYQQGGGSFGSNGNKNGGTGKATIVDVPNTNGLEKEFYKPGSKEDGWKKVQYKFETFAWCMKGKDCPADNKPTWYEGIKWEFTKTWEEVRDGKKGKSKVTDEQVDSPSKDFLDAFNKFNKRHGFTPCKS